MSYRYFVDEPISPGRVVLAGREAHHLIHVMRAVPGMQVVLFDGGGAEFPAVVQQIDRNTVVLSAPLRKEIHRELTLDITLGVALPKGERQKWLVEKATELGVTRIVPLRTQHAVAQPVAQALVRLRRIVVESSKQCGRNRLMQICEPQNWSSYVEHSTGTKCRLLAQPEGFHKGPHLPIPDELPARVLLAVGPEGGFAGQEIAQAVLVGWHTVDLGPRVLRIETAALVLAALVASGRGG
jgi:16S rRNA (uracil1498-N3)-methyltransferase